MKTADLKARAGYVADIAAELANLMADHQSIAQTLRFVALESALIALRSGEFGDDAG